MGLTRTSRVIASIRREAGLTQEALANKLGVSFVTVNSWERGRSAPRRSHLDRINRLAEELGVRTDLVVLAIDDDPTACAIIEGLVAGSSVPASVETTTDPNKGLILCGALAPDLLLMDVMMPGMNGFEVARQLAEIRADQLPTIVFVTSSSDPSIAQQATDLGHSILLKPMRQKTIDALLLAAASGEPPPLGLESR